MNRHARPVPAVMNINVGERPQEPTWAYRTRSLNRRLGTKWHATTAPASFRTPCGQSIDPHFLANVDHLAPGDLCRKCFPEAKAA